MITLVWVVWLTFATEGGVSFGVLTLTKAECEIKGDALVTIAGWDGIAADRGPCVPILAQPAEAAD